MQATFNRIALVATVGTALEWGEFIFFAYLMGQLSTLFFSNASPEVARLNTYAIFAVSYLVRPLGSLIFGYIGDQYGRKPALIGSLFLMGLATTSIGLLPTYQQIGAAAPLLLMACRLLQGLAVAGEFNGAAVLLHESAHSKQRHFACALTPFAASLGMVVGGLIALLCQMPSFPDWGWRIPFLSSGLLAYLAYYLRRNMLESPLFQQPRQSMSPWGHLKKILQTERRGLLTTASLGMFVSVFVYLGSIFYKSLCIHQGGLDPQTTQTLITGGQFLTTVLILVWAHVASQWNGRLLCLLGLALAMFLSPWMMGCAFSGNLTQAILGQGAYALINSLVSATFFHVFLSQFSVQAKYTGSSLSWSIPCALFSGSSLYLGEWMITRWNWPEGPGIYISTCAAITGTIVYFTTRIGRVPKVQIA